MTQEPPQGPPMMPGPGQQQQQGGLTVPVTFQPGPANVSVEKGLVNGQIGFFLMVWTPQSTNVTFWDEESYRNLWEQLGKPLMGGLEVAKMADVQKLFGPNGQTPG